MADFVAFLEYGVLGLCAITLVLVWRVIQAEQKRDGQPRKRILHASYVFMAFAFALAIINSYVQLSERGNPEETEVLLADLRADLDTAQQELRKTEDKLLKITSAADPILNSRANILGDLPPGPARNALQTLVENLRDVLAE